MENVAVMDEKALAALALDGAVEEVFPESEQEDSKFPRVDGQLQVLANGQAFIMLGDIRSVIAKLHAPKPKKDEKTGEMKVNAGIRTVYARVNRTKIGPLFIEAGINLTARRK